MRDLTPEEERVVERIMRTVRQLTWFVVLFVTVIIIQIAWPPFLTLSWVDFGGEEEQLAQTEAPASAEEITLPLGSIDPESGLLVDEHYQLVANTCGGCHSTKLVTQNRATREGWKELIVWMQETQKLWDLGNNEPLILDYLEKNYGPTKKGRRAMLTDIEWYALEE